MTSKLPELYAGTLVQAVENVTPGLTWVWNPGSVLGLGPGVVWKASATWVQLDTLPVIRQAVEDTVIRVWGKENWVSTSKDFSVEWKLQPSYEWGEPNTLVLALNYLPREGEIFLTLYNRSSGDTKSTSVKTMPRQRYDDDYHHYVEMPKYGDRGYYDYRNTQVLDEAQEFISDYEHAKPGVATMITVNKKLQGGIKEDIGKEYASEGLASYSSLKYDATTALQAGKDAIANMLWDWDQADGLAWRVTAKGVSFREAVLVHCAIEESLQSAGWLEGSAYSFGTWWVPNPVGLSDRARGLTLGLDYSEAGIRVTLSDKSVKVSKPAESVPSVVPARVIRRLTGDKDE